MEELLFVSSSLCKSNKNKMNIFEKVRIQHKNEILYEFKMIIHPLPFSWIIAVFLTVHMFLPWKKKSSFKIQVSFKTFRVKSKCPSLSGSVYLPYPCHQSSHLTSLPYSSSPILGLGALTIAWNASPLPQQPLAHPFSSCLEEIQE